MANVKDTDGQQVWLDDVEVLNEFIDEESNELVAKHAQDIANNVQGDTNLKLTRNGTWFVFPQGTEVQIKDCINKYGQEALRSALGLYQLVLPFPRLLELMKLPPHYRMSHLPLFISHQWMTYPEELLKSLKAMPPAATREEIHGQLNQSINQKPLHALLYSSSPSHHILPIPRLLKLLKLPPNLNPAHLPLFMMTERETCPEELLSRLMMMSKEENILPMLMTENVIKENDQLRTETLEPVKKMKKTSQNLLKQIRNQKKLVPKSIKQKKPNLKWSPNLKLPQKIQ